MQNYLSASDISNEMSMMRSVFKGTYLVVEGATDCRLYSKFIDGDKVKIIVAHSKNNVVQSVSECRTRRRDMSVIGFIDRDMDAMLGKKRVPPLFITDKRDMESTVLSTNALKDVLAEYGDPEKIRKFEEKYGPIGEAVAKASAPVGMLMYISYKKGMNLSFKDIDFTLFTDPRSLNTDLSKLVATIYGISMQQRYSRSAITDLLATAVSEVEDLWSVARGHDAVAILRLGLKYAFGAYNTSGITNDAVGGALRLAYSREYFTDSTLFKDSEEWSRKNNLALWSTQMETDKNRVDD